MKFDLFIKLKTFDKLTNTIKDESKNIEFLYFMFGCVICREDLKN